jgi:hypothetical protein
MDHKGTKYGYMDLLAQNRSKIVYEFLEQLSDY